MVCVCVRARARVGVVQHKNNEINAVSLFIYIVEKSNLSLSSDLRAVPF